MFCLRKAVENDRNWLNTCNLSLSAENICDVHRYFVLQSLENDEPIGMLAVELYDEVAYLHSLRFIKVAPTLQQLGRLFDHIIAYCQTERKQQLCMVVPSASEGLLALGFDRLQHVPPAVAASAHYQRVAAAGTLVGLALEA